MEAGADGGSVQLREIEVWFRERRVALRYDRVKDAWVALIIPDDLRVGAVDGGHGATKLDAARDAKARYERRELGDSGVVGIKITPSADEGGPRSYVREIVDNVGTALQDVLEVDVRRAGESPAETREEIA